MADDTYFTSWGVLGLGIDFYGMDDKDYMLIRLKPCLRTSGYKVKNGYIVQGDLKVKVYYNGNTLVSVSNTDNDIYSDEIRLDKFVPSMTITYSTQVIGAVPYVPTGVIAPIQG